MFLSAFGFGGGQRADAGDRSPWGRFWFEPLGMRAATGVRITQVSAMRLTAVYASVRVVSESFAVLPFRMYKKQASGGRTPITDHWLVRLMRRPNDWQTGFEWREMMQAHLCLRGNCFNQIVSDGRGGIKALIPIHPDRINATNTAGGYAYLVTNPDGTQTLTPRQDIWHVRGLSSDGVVGLNPIEMAADVMGMGLAAQSYAARFFANDARPGGWLEYDGKFADQNAKQTFRDSWQKLQGGANRGKVAVLEKGFKYHETTVNNADSQFLETTKQGRSEIAGIFRVPPHKIGDLDRATFSNIEQQSLDFVNDCMLPWSERWESSIETNLLPDDELDSTEIEFDFANLLRGDMAARTQYYTGNIINGSMTRNEARILEGRNPLPGLDVPLAPMNMTSGTKLPDPVAPMQQPEQPSEPQQVPSPKPRKKAEGDDDRMSALARAAAERLARRETKELLAALQAKAGPEHVARVMARHAETLQSALGVTAEAAAGYVAARSADPIQAGSEEEDIYSAAVAKLETLALKGTL